MIANASRISIITTRAPANTASNFNIVVGKFSLSRLKSKNISNMLKKLINSPLLFFFFFYLIVLCVSFFYLIVDGFRYAFLNLTIFEMYSFYSWSWINFYTNSTSFHIIVNLIWYIFFCSSLRIISLGGCEFCFRKWLHAYLMTSRVCTCVIITFIFIIFI